MTRTKIVCTIGPACSSEDQIKSLVRAGMNVARLNFSHGTHEEHGERIRLLKKVRQELNVPLAIMLDTKGPEIRLGKLQEESLLLKPGQRLRLIKKDVLGNEKHITLKPASVLDSLIKNMVILLDDGYIVTHVVDIDSEGVEIEVDHGGTIRSTKGVNIPGANIHLPSLTENDIADIRFGCKQDVDFIAASFIRTAEDVLEIKNILKEEGRCDISVIAKIEHAKGVENFKNILGVCEGIMVARGDLGVELPLNQVPRLQKWMIRKSYQVGRSSVTATQMLESMIVNPRPTRAEVSDVANAIYDSTSAVMLSGETAVGNYPIKTVQMMKSIIAESELDFDYEEFFRLRTEKIIMDVASSVAAASIKTAYSAHAKAIFAFTTSGATANMLSHLRPRIPIIAMTSNPKVYHQLALSWGIIPILDTKAHNFEEAYKNISAFALQKKYVQEGDLVVITAGTPFGCAGTTNMMIVSTIGGRSAFN
ncbi:MAG: pyruvate kinase [Verrucomicrobia bacterium]|nr:pyruvate kinase [Verrucomicrobiota bacterium]MBS0646735.1 pyruvate kinase [Verrucomicrobiota bacterium]